MNTLEIKTTPIEAIRLIPKIMNNFGSLSVPPSYWESYVKALVDHDTYMRDRLGIKITETAIPDPHEYSHPMQATYYINEGDPVFSTPGMVEICITYNGIDAIDIGINFNRDSKHLALQIAMVCYQHLPDQAFKWVGILAECAFARYHQMCSNIQLQLSLEQQANKHLHEDLKEMRKQEYEEAMVE